MNSKDLLSDFDFGPGDPRPSLLLLKLFTRYLADNVYDSTLNSGERISDATAFKIWLRELSEAARTLTLETAGKKLPPSPQRRWNEFCPDCGHIHIEDSECGFPQGGGRVCRCERAVT